ncbi:LCP family protein [Pseudanabaena sp. PCC 6802]|uniref:LCP family protein n=1 Tax=Pseudanabaena sp. PCC 6802 TaxID=118173 RepID=UPI00034A1566|nr:LCP family protein [Pseudanabaena sp. PCC 6802]
MSTNPITNLVKSSQRGKFIKRLPKISTRLKVLLVSLALLSGSMGAALAFLMTSKPFQQTQTSGITNSNSMTATTAGLPELTRSVNILILGTIVLTSDLPDAEQQPKGRYLAQVNSTLNGQSDAILLVRFDPFTKKLTALSIPRDSRVNIPELGYRKINAANYVGGASLSAQIVSQTLGNVEIDRYFRVNVDGFGKLIDALGGVDIYVPKRMKYQDDSQHLYINLNPGQQHLDGNKAIQYMRFRHDDLGDIGRVQRQQTLIRALIEQKLNLATISRLPDILAVLKENIDTNLSVEEMLALAAFAAKTDRKNAQMLMAPGRFSAPNEYPISYWILNERHLMRLMANYFQVNVPSEALDEVNRSPSSLRVAVQDSISNPEGVKVAKDILVKAGYGDVFPADEPWANPLEKTKIIAQQGDLESAEEVRNTLGIGEIVLESTGSLESDVTVRLGRDWLDLKSIQVYKPKPLLDRS